MRHIAFILLYLSIIQVLCSQDLKEGKAFFIKGNFVGKNIKTLSLVYTDNNNMRVAKKAHIANSHFTFTGIIKEPTIADLTGDLASNRADDNNYTRIFIEPKNIKINLEENHFKSIKVFGLETQNQYDSLKKSKLSIHNQIAPLDSLLNILNDSLDSAFKKSDSVQINDLMKKRSLVLSKIEPYTKQQNQMDLKFIAENPNSYLSAFLLNQQFLIYNLENDSVKFYYNRFSSNIQTSQGGIIIVKELKKKENSTIGHKAQNFETLDINNNIINLSSFEDKAYVILDFWASWCEPCREANPHLKLLYKKYNKAGFEIIAISEDADKKAWAKAIAQDSTNMWHHVLGAKNLSNPDDKDIMAKYECRPIPIHYLINKEGRIIGRWVGQSKENEDDIDKKLKEVFGF